VIILTKTNNHPTQMKNQSVTLRSRLPLARKIALSSLAGLSLVASALAQPRYAVTDLGVLPGYDTSVATGLNDRGDIVGYCMGPADPSGSAVEWLNGSAPLNLGKLTGGIYSAAAAINSQGVVVGDGDTGNYRPQSWVTTSSGLYNFFPNNGGNTHSIFIGDNGFIGGYYTKSLSGNTSSWRASLWTPDPKDPRKYRQTDLPVIPGINSKYTSVISWAFNQSGQAAGWAVNDIIGQHACFWNNDSTHSIVDLGTLPGDWSSIAWGMNSLGQVVGESHPPAGCRPAVWNNDAAHAATELPLLPGDNYGTASAINNLGQILGSSAYGVPGTLNVSPAKLVIWRDGGVFELQSVLDANTGAGWTLSTAAAINNLGQIVGLGVHNGQNHAFLLTPMAQ
jgi:probable HAF family extracellular repeat protein